MLDNEHQNIKVALIFCFKLYKLLLQLRKQFLTRILVCKYGHLLENPTSYSSTKHNSQSCLSTNYTRSHWLCSASTQLEDSMRDTLHRLSLGVSVLAKMKKTMVIKLLIRIFVRCHMKLYSITILLSPMNCWRIVHHFLVRQPYATWKMGLDSFQWPSIVRVTGSHQTTPYDVAIF